MSITDDIDYIHTWAEGASVTRWVAKGWSSYGAVQASAARGSELSKPSSDTMVMSPNTGVEASSAPCTPDPLSATSVATFCCNLQLFCPKGGTVGILLTCDSYKPLLANAEPCLSYPQCQYWSDGPGYNLLILWGLICQ